MSRLMSWGECKTVQCKTVQDKKVTCRITLLPVRAHELAGDRSVGPFSTVRKKIVTCALVMLNFPQHDTVIRTPCSVHKVKWITTTLWCCLCSDLMIKVTLIALLQKRHTHVHTSAVTLRCIASQQVFFQICDICFMLSIWERKCLKAPP